MAVEKNPKPHVDNDTDQPLQRLQRVRDRQGLSRRCLARRLGVTEAAVRLQEDPEADMWLSELYRWQSALDVPLRELLVEPREALDTEVEQRARLLKVMKTLQSLRGKSLTKEEREAVEGIAGMILTAMPELAEVSGWPVVGQRRAVGEVGRIAEQPITPDYFGSLKSSDG